MQRCTLISAVWLGSVVSCWAALLVPGQYPTIQAAIDAAVDGDTIRVAAGEYEIGEPLTFDGKLIVVTAEAGADHTTIRMTQPVEPLRASVVIFENGETRDAVLEGFTLTGGQGTIWPGKGNCGGGILCRDGSSPEVRACRIRENLGDFHGGGILIESQCSPLITGCEIVNNYALAGGGVYSRAGASPEIAGCSIRGNRVTKGGGGIAYMGSAGIVRNCTILGNEAQTAAGINFSDGCAPNLVNCVIAGNAATVHGSVLACYYSARPHLVNCTIAQNGLSNEVPLVYCMNNDSHPQLTNCIVWGNEPQTFCGDTDHILVDEDPRFTKEGAFDFQRHQGIYRVPDFVLSMPDYHLQSGSPAIDAGTSDGTPPEDMDGRPRWDDPGTADSGAGDIPYYDIGACEYVRPDAVAFRRGDANASDGAVNIADGIYILQNLFAGGPPIPCPDAADANDDESVNIADAIFILQNLFAGGPPIPPPHPACGIDTTQNPDPQLPDLPACAYDQELCN